jgi:NADPH:quinone reductase-like Zn-dependent oxidoreductase
MPPGVGFAAAATVPMNGLTAAMAIEAVEAGAAKSVLVTGGAGAVGSYSIQLAKAAGLVVLADALDRDCRFIGSLGADVVVRRGHGMSAAVRNICADGVDAVIDAARIGPDARQLVRDGGTFVAVRSDEDISGTRVTSVFLSVTGRLGDTTTLRHLARMLAAGTLITRIARTMPFERAIEAHRMLEQGGIRGRVVLTFDE